MPGFLVTNTNISLELKDRFLNKVDSFELRSGDILAIANFLKKFQKDKTFFENEKYIVIQDGVILNKQELFKQLSVGDISDLIIKLYEKNEEFFNIFRGPFSGAFYDKEKNKWFIYTNHVGDSPVFYTGKDEKFVVGSRVNYLIDVLHALDWEMNIDEQAIYQMMTFGFMESDHTYAKEIRRLLPGEYIIISKDGIEVKTYHQFKKNIERFRGISEEDIIEEIDKAFVRAVKLEYEKDEEYGYKHLADLSGGLDSRMNIWVAHTLKHRRIQCLNWGRSNGLDEIVSKEIAAYWKDSILIRPLEDLHYLYDVDEIVDLNGGSALYQGITGGKRLLDSIEMGKYGLKHTGQLGDVVLGSYLLRVRQLNSGEKNGHYSNILNYRLLDTRRTIFEDTEMYLLQSRGMLGMLSTHITIGNYTYVTSPFLDVDFFQLCMDIPLELRANHYIYKKWILAKYPQAAGFVWEKIGDKITASKQKLFIKKVLKRGPRKILKRLGFKLKELEEGMNPLDYWISRDKNIQEYMDSYAKEKFERYRCLYSKDLLSDMKQLYKIGNANEKAMVLTALSATRLFFENRIKSIDTKN